MNQYYISCDTYEKDIAQMVQTKNVKCILVVGKKWIERLPIMSAFKKIIEGLEIKVIFFDDFSSNPKYEEIENGIKIFNNNNCQFIIAVGGGSAIDVAKCIKLFANMNTKICCLGQKITSNDISLLAVPTTAGSGSEATRFAVVYMNGEKKSVYHYSCRPQYVILDPQNLITLPLYQKKVTLCDALSHAMESYWSIRSTVESREISEKAISMILDNITGYLSNNIDSIQKMQKAANMAGKAIDITTTTAAHAMSYKLTTEFEIAHGHAVILCLPEVWKYMWEHIDLCRDERGKQYVKKTLRKLAECLGQNSPEEAICFLKNLREKLELNKPKNISKSKLQTMAYAVNTQRLDNFPIVLNTNNILSIYENILK